jgi:hypothetical protein
MTEDLKMRAAVSIRQKLLNLAKERNEDFGLVLTRYALERFLFRLSRSTIQPSWRCRIRSSFRIRAKLWLQKN